MVPLFKYRKYTGFEIDFLLGTEQTTSSGASNKDSGTVQRKMMDAGRLYCESSGSLPICANHVHSKDINFCTTCFENNSHENLINNIRPYEIPSYSDLMRSGGLSTNTLPLIDTVNVVPQIQNTDIRQPSLGSLGIKLHNNLTHLENLSNLSNISNINPGYSSIANLYSPSSHLARVCSPPHIDRGLSGTTLSWTQTRAGGLFTSRCNDNTALFMSPYRKPKRIRTAFSPTQLLRLEHAFEKNHYVVGQERKDLASSLNLSETQVKVWFQNRRTKHKRNKAEDDITAGLRQREHMNETTA